MGNIIEIISNFISITGDPVIDNIILTIVGVISFVVAFGAIGMIFDKLGKYDSDIMSGAHWIVRIIIFLIISVLLYALINFIKCLFSFPWWVYIVLLAIIIVIFVFIFYFKHKKSKKKHCEITNIPENSDENKKREICPRCGGTMVERFGPFGKFYGCSNYSKNNCRYTRNCK